MILKKKKKHTRLEKKREKGNKMGVVEEKNFR